MFGGLGTMLSGWAMLRVLRRVRLGGLTQEYAQVA
jgi:hypothetical protein